RPRLARHDTNPRRVRQVETEEPHVVPDGGLASERVGPRLGLQIGIVLPQGVEGRIRQAADVGGVFVVRQRQKGGIGTEHGDGPAVVVLLPLDLPILRVEEADAVLFESCGHDRTLAAAYELLYGASYVLRTGGGYCYDGAPSRP